jgi:hypothetical protein
MEGITILLKLCAVPFHRLGLWHTSTPSFTTMLLPLHIPQAGTASMSVRYIVTQARLSQLHSSPAAGCRRLPKVGWGGRWLGMVPPFALCMVRMLQ